MIVAPSWVLILFLGKVVGVVGPLDWGISICKAHIQEREWFRPQIERTGHPIESVTLTCEQHSLRPHIGEER